MRTTEPFRDLETILKEVAPIGTRLQQHGYCLYLVGGIVRDLYLNRASGAELDIDLTTDALAETVKELVGDMAQAIWTQGQRFGTIGLKYNGRDLEITTHRAESYNLDSRKPQVSFGTDIKVDLSRRDFTVNAMAIKIPEGVLVDPWAGAGDLEAKRLATPIEADISFSDDPLRMMRAARFMTKYDLVPSDELHDAATRLASRIDIVAVERIGQEWRRLLSLANPASGVDFLVDTGLLAHVLCAGRTERFETLDAKVSPFRTGGGVGGGGVGGASSSLGEVVASNVADWRVRLATLCFAVLFDVAAVKEVLSALRLSRDEKHHVNKLVELTSRVLGASDFEPSWLRRFVYDCATEDVRSQVLSVAAAVAPLQDGVAKVAELETALSSLAQSEILERPTLLTGVEIMAAQDRDSGRWVGEAQKALLDVYFTNGPLSAAEQAAVVKALPADD